MRVEIACKSPMRRWQRRLAEELAACGHDVVCVAARRRCRGFGVSAALIFEQRVFGPRMSLFDLVETPSPLRKGPAERLADLVIVLDGEQAGPGPILEPLFDDGLGDAALLAMLTSGSAPSVRVRSRIDGDACDIVTARLAVEDRDVLSRALDSVLARIVTLILQAVRRLERGEPGKVQQPQPRPPSLVSPLSYVARAFTRKIAERLPGVKRGPSHWRIGYRFRSDPGIARDTSWATRPFTILLDDGARFYADPVPFTHEGRRYIFLEDFPYATEKAVIGVTEIGADGTASPPRTVLEQPCHLSYPFLIRHGGEIYMLPEMSGARRVQLFRADPFPDRWVPDRVLLDGGIVADATLIRHHDRWWMFATIADDGGSSWDQLCLFHAPDLFGPWTPHADNPVLVDAGEARPAGAMWHENGVLMRVAQDCRGGYGVGLAICRVDRLDASGYTQTVIARLAPPDGSGANGVHTLDQEGALEVIDLRFPAAARFFAPSPYPAAPP